MSTEYFIDKDRTLTKSQDYEYLRASGRDYIERLSHRLWTDYNTHDPGITILEVLSYAITELGYRTNFDIENLLANEDGKVLNQTFFTAQNILTNAPLTQLDFRKLLMDIEGVNNAWIIYYRNEQDDCGYNLPLDNEVPIYISPREDKLSLSTPDPFGNPLEKLKIRGLNKVIVELSDDFELGQLNEVEIEHSWIIDDFYVSTTLSLGFDSWDHPKADLFQKMNTVAKIQILSQEESEGSLVLTIAMTTDADKSLTLKIKAHDPSELSLVTSYFSVAQHIIDVIKTFERKKEKVAFSYDQIREVLNKNRNLTEDWLCVTTINNLDIGVCVDIALENEADAEEIMSKVQQTIDELFNPPVHFYTLPQLLELGLTPGQIFNGPSLNHGFLMDEEVQNAQLPDCIHVSDLIAALMNIKGLKSVNNVMLTAYDELGKPIPGSANMKWCLQLSGQQRPVFDFKRSKILLFRDGIPFVLPEKGMLEFSEGVFYLKSQNNTHKLQGPENDFEIPTGTYYQLDDYHSIQNDFPLAYGIGEGHLSDKAPNLRKAQAKQLKAYLQHFDQLLADFFSQLYNAKNLLDIKPLATTYFPKYLEDISGVDQEYFSEEVYSSEFKTNLLFGVGMEKRSLYEDDKLFYDRRNRQLDHLLARFGESFNDYVFMTHRIQQNAKGIAELTLQQGELIEDKQDFLREYPKLSYNRGLGLNYLENPCETEVEEWKIPERGGYEQRIAGLLGMDKIDFENIVDNEPKSTWTYQTELGPLSFSLMNSTSSSLQEKWELAHLLINNVTAYRIFTFTKTFIYFIQKDGKKIAKLNKSFDSYEKAEDFIPKLYEAINSELENFYCIEHILLRPMVNENLTDNDLLDVCLTDDCYTEANNDPYSFKATLVLPGWLARFRNRHFRNYAENIFRKEAPAHTLIKVCWVGREDMVAFQKVYQQWMLAYHKLKCTFCKRTLRATEKKEYNKALSELVAQLKELNTIYDEGTLYDCKESALDNPIVLNNSSLGTLQNIPS